MTDFDGNEFLFDDHFRVAVGWQVIATIGYGSGCHWIGSSFFSVLVFLFVTIGEICQLSGDSPKMLTEERNRISLARC